MMISYRAARTAALAMLLPFVFVPLHVLPQEILDRQQPQQVPGLKVVDEVTVKYDTIPGVTRVVLGVDQDDFIKVYRWSEEHGRVTTRPEIIAYLGQRVTHSGSLALEPLLPKREVAAEAFRFTRNELTRYHVVLTWRFLTPERKGPSGNVYYSLYVITEDLQKKTARVTYKEDEINAELRGFLARDLSGDGSVVIVDVGSEAKVAFANVRVLDTSGNVHLVQTVDAGYEIYLLGTRWAESGGSMLLEDEVLCKDLKPERCPSYRNLQWSPEKKQFLPPK
jgi:hypothetical protein